MNEKDDRESKRGLDEHPIDVSLVFSRQSADRFIQRFGHVDSNLSGSLLQALERINMRRNKERKSLTQELFIVMSCLSSGQLVDSNYKYVYLITIRHSMGIYAITDIN